MGGTPYVEDETLRAASAPLGYVQEVELVRGFGFRGLLLGTEEAGEEVSHTVEEASGGWVLARCWRGGDSDGWLRGRGLHWHG
jgi:hypothetical protein